MYAHLVRAVAPAPRSGRGSRRARGALPPYAGVYGGEAADRLLDGGGGAARRARVVDGERHLLVVDEPRGGQLPQWLVCARTPRATTMTPQVPLRGRATAGRAGAAGGADGRAAAVCTVWSSRPVRARTCAHGAGCRGVSTRPARLVSVTTPKDTIENINQSVFVSCRNILFLKNVSLWKSSYYFS
ncbi:hypothetical protein FGB62_10g23 [Gracilaria domingensis]|nr:hypothetical protein FGB62_10g23 [Gracilaria domingensis]